MNKDLVANIISFILIILSVLGILFLIGQKITEECANVDCEQLALDSSNEMGYTNNFGSYLIMAFIASFFAGLFLILIIGWREGMNKFNKEFVLELLYFSALLILMLLLGIISSGIFGENSLSEFLIGFGSLGIPLSSFVILWSIFLIFLDNKKSEEII